MKKKLIAVCIAAAFGIGALVLFVASSSTSDARHINCSQVRCAACPDGSHFAPTPGNCCRCLPN